jgi:deazaflavin-dependent oxidoreductase (nitroreductase family)
MSGLPSKNAYDARGETAVARAAVPAKTPWFISRVMNPIFTLSGAFPIVSVKGRRSGKVYRTPINVVDLNGVLYLVSPRGETGWSRNLRAVGECTLKMKGQERRYRGTEVPPAERGPMIQAYLNRWGNQTRAQFEQLPDPIDHPTFRLNPI